MKIAITAAGSSLEDQVDPRFGRCRCFLIADTDSFKYEVIENPNTAVGGGAGIQSAQLMVNKGIEAVLTGNCGPNAFQVFSAAGIKVIIGVSGIIKQAINNYKAGKYSGASQPNVASHFGMGMGSGRGTGMGMGMGIDGNINAPSPAGRSMTKEQEIDLLKQQLQTLENQKNILEERINKSEENN